ncbi:MAG: sulfotransferase family 2 domain-containing protein [Pseudomonadota bacterium]
MSFSSFVILAGMRTGSNFLEANLNSFDSFQSYGELFNPHFVGQHNKDAALGITLDQREADPFALLGAIKADASGMPGFRLFHDHDTRVIDHVLEDRRCAKIVLTRDPLESYVSLRIATQTGQWKLSDLRKRKEAQVNFDLAGFERHLAARNGFLADIRSKLQRSGQSAFYLSYEDVGDIDVLNGLSRYLGSDEVLKSVSKKTKKQNPSGLADKVSNYEEMRDALATLDHFGTHQPEDFEPSRGGGVPGYIATSAPPLLFLPVKNGLEAQIEAWLKSVSGEVVQTDFSQKSLRQWKKQNPGFRSFTVLRHPMARAFQAFRETVLAPEELRLQEIARLLGRRYQVECADPNDPQAIAESFLRFLVFLKGNLTGQTSLRVEQVWASQSSVLAGMSAVQSPDFIFREDQISRDLARLAADFGIKADFAPMTRDEGQVTLADLYDDQLEKACFQAYRKDYIAFGFKGWTQV